MGVRKPPPLSCLLVFGPAVELMSALGCRRGGRREGPKVIWTHRAECGQNRVLTKLIGSGKGPFLLAKQKMQSGTPWPKCGVLTLLRICELLWVIGLG